MIDMDLWDYDYKVNHSSQEIEEDCKKIRKSLNRFNENYTAAKNLLDSPKLNHEASDIRTQVLIMIVRKASAESIDRYLDNALPKMWACVEEYKSKNSEFSRFQDNHNQKLLDAEQKISCALTNSTPFMLPKSNANSSTQELLQRMPGYWEQREDMIGLMSVTSGAATIVDYVNRGLEGWANEVGENVKNRARVLCKRHPEMCQKLQNIPSLNDVIDSAGKGIEKKLTHYCTKNDTNRNRCKVVLNIGKGFGQAVQDSEPRLPTQPIKISLPDIESGTKAIDKFWSLKSGSSNAYLASMGTILLTVNPFGKAGKTAVSALNNSQYKTLKTLFSAQKTTPPAWNQIEQLFKSLGCEIIEKERPRIKVSYQGIEQRFHVPNREIDRGILVKVRNFLENIDAVPLDDGKLRIKK